MISALAIKNRIDKASRRTEKKNGAVFAGCFFIAIGVAILLAAYFFIR